MSRMPIYDGYGNIVLEKPDIKEPKIEELKEEFEEIINGKKQFFCDFCTRIFDTSQGKAVHQGWCKENPHKRKKKTSKTPKVKTQFTFFEYLKRRFKLSFVAGMFKEAKTTISEWDMLVQTLSNLLNKKILDEEKL